MLPGRHERDIVVVCRAVAGRPGFARSISGGAREAGGAHGESRAWGGLAAGRQLAAGGWPAGRAAAVLLAGRRRDTAPGCLREGLFAEGSRPR